MAKEKNQKDKDLEAETTPEQENLPSITGEATSAPVETPAPRPQAAANEQMIGMSTVKQMIAEALAQASEASKPQKVKRVMTHEAHIHRFNGKWVVDFADRNFDYETGEKIDKYVKEPIQAYKLWNDSKREFESWITLIFHDGSKESIPLNRYLERRIDVYATIVKRHQKDLTYEIGDVEQKKWVGDRKVGSGVYVPQEVNMYSELFELKTPDGEEFLLPDYVLA